MQRYVAKIIAIIISFVLPMFFTMLPYSMHGYIISKGRAGERVLTYLMCFGGGIFFGTYLLHMGPEVRYILAITLLDDHNIVYPVADLVIGLGFFFVLFLEKAVMRVNKRRNQRRRERLQDNCLVYQHGGGASGGRVCDDCMEKRPCAGLTESVAWPKGGEEAVSAVAQAIGDKIALADVTMTSEVETTEFRDACCATVKDAEVSSAGKDATAISVICRPSDDDPSSPSDPSAVQRGDHHHDHHHDHNHNHDHDQLHDDHAARDAAEEEADHHNMRSLILVMALSLHHLFEGLTVGLQSTIPLLITLMFAIMCHECIISFSVGMTFTRCKYTFKRHLVTAFVTCSIMPIGEAIGTLLSEVGQESNALDMASGFLQAFSTGTFIFVTFFEILGEEISPHDTSFGKVASAFLGFMVMACLMLIPEEPASSVELTTEVAGTTVALPFVQAMEAWRSISGS